MHLSGRERFLTALANQRPDRLPCQVYRYSALYLKTALPGMAQYDAYARIGVDPVIYCSPRFSYAETSQANWQIKRQELTAAPTGEKQCAETIVTPSGKITCKYAITPATQVCSEYLIKTEQDFEIWNKYAPVPVAVDWSPAIFVKQRIEDNGIIRGTYFENGPGSPWQCLCALCGEAAVKEAVITKPKWVHQCLESILRKRLRLVEIGGMIDLDLVETGGGGSGNLEHLSADCYREFALPYDQRLHAALRSAGAKSAYYLQGNSAHLLPVLAQNGATGYEIAAPGGQPSTLVAMRKLLNDRQFLMGGFDPQLIETGTSETVAQRVRELHESFPKGGYVCAPSGEFYGGNPELLKAFVAALNECNYWTTEKFR